MTAGYTRIRELPFDAWASSAVFGFLWCICGFQAPSAPQQIKWPRSSVPPALRRLQFFEINLYLFCVFWFRFEAVEGFGAYGSVPYPSCKLTLFFLTFLLPSQKISRGSGGWVTLLESLLLSCYFLVPDSPLLYSSSVDPD